MTFMELMEKFPAEEMVVSYYIGIRYPNGTTCQKPPTRKTPRKMGKIKWNHNCLVKCPPRAFFFVPKVITKTRCLCAKRHNLKVKEITAIWFCVASSFAAFHVGAADFPSRFRATQNQIAIATEALKCRNRVCVQALDSCAFFCFGKHATRIVYFHQYTTGESFIFSVNMLRWKQNCP